MIKKSVHEYQFLNSSKKLKIKRYLQDILMQGLKNIQSKNIYLEMFTFLFCKVLKSYRLFT